MVDRGGGRQGGACGLLNLANVATEVMAEVATRALRKSNVVGI